MNDSDLMKEYNHSKLQIPLFSKKKENYLPLTYVDSLSPIPNYPFCTLGVLNAEAKWGRQKGIAFVVQDNYLLTCASNCFSNKHGEYPDITFTIASNRKHGSDTYKITKVFIPKQYKTLAQQKRNQHKYALLYIDGEPNLKDKYGSLKIVKAKDGQNAFTYHCTIKEHDELQMISQLKLNEAKQMAQECLPNGMPRIKWNNISAKVEGLVFQLPKSNFLFSLKFDQNVEKQLSLWAREQRGLMTLHDIPVEGFDLKCFKTTKAEPIGTIIIDKCKTDHKKITYMFKQLPFSSVSSLQMHHCQAGVNVDFLSMDKFTNLKQLILKCCKIGPNGCKDISGISLPNLRRLELDENKLGYKGCENLSKSKWPFLQILSLGKIQRDKGFCSVNSAGLQILLNARFRNLLSLNLQANLLDREALQILRNAGLLRITVLNKDMRPDFRNAFYSIRFVKAPAWRQLSDVNFSFLWIGNHGCKMIKQSACALRHLTLEFCLITERGVKWLCKADTSRMITLNLAKNQISYKGCLYLAKANFSTLEVFEYYQLVYDHGWVFQRAIEYVIPKALKILIKMEHKKAEYISDKWKKKKFNVLRDLIWLKR